MRRVAARGRDGAPCAERDMNQEGERRVRQVPEGARLIGADRFGLALTLDQKSGEGAEGKPHGKKPEEKQSVKLQCQAVKPNTGE